VLGLGDPSDNLSIEGRLVERHKEYLVIRNGSGDLFIPLEAVSAAWRPKRKRISFDSGIR